MLVAHAKKLLSQLRNNALNVATCNKDGEPNAAVKLFLKMKGEEIYLADFSMGTTCNNLQANPQLSLAFEDVETSKGYRINGRVVIISEGPEYDALVEDVRKRETEIVVNRVLEGLQRNRRYKGHMVSTCDKFVIYKITIEQIVEFGPQGALRTEDLKPKA